MNNHDTPEPSLDPPDEPELWLSVVGEEIAEAVHLDTAIISQDTDGVVDVEATEYGPAHDPETGEVSEDE